MLMLRKLLFAAAFLACLALGRALEVRVSTQDARMIYAVDSASGASVVIQTDGSGALKVLVK